MIILLLHIWYNFSYLFLQIGPESFKDKQPSMMPDFPLVPASKGFCLSLDKSLEAFKTALKAANLWWYEVCSLRRLLNAILHPLNLYILNSTTYYYLVFFNLIKSWYEFSQYILRCAFLPKLILCRPIFLCSFFLV